MNNTPLVSIIIPTYNSAHLIEETLKSVFLQTYYNWECIIVDDGSNDNTETVVKKWQEKDQRFLYINIKKTGASHSRNIGFEKARGSYIQYLDADDLLHPEKLEKQLGLMLANKLDLSYTHWSHFTDSISEKAHYRFWNVKVREFLTGKDIIESFGMQNWFVPPISWLVTRHLIEAAGQWNPSITNNDDGEYFARVLCKAEKVMELKQILAYYRITKGNSLSKLNTEDKIDSAYFSYQLIVDLLKKEKDSKLMSYPKRLCYVQFSIIKKDYPELAKRTAKLFDQINANCFLSKRKKYWKIINCFGLYKGEIIFNFIVNCKSRLNKVMDKIISKIIVNGEG